MNPVVNPYAKPRSAAPAMAHNEANMGRQSQQRVSNQHKRKFKLCGNNNRKRQKGDQLTLQGDIAFDAVRDCKVCRAKEIRKTFPQYTLPKRAHHEFCSFNTKTRGLGMLTEQSIASIADNKRYKAITAPITPAERFSSKHATKAVGESFFSARQPKTMTTATSQKEAEPPLTKEAFVSSPFDLSTTIKAMVNDPTFREKHKSKGAPLAMIAFADEVSKKIDRNDNIFFDYFRGGVQLEVPACEDESDNPHYHSIIGQRLLYIGWERTHGIQVPCPDSNCAGTLETKRTNYSKNKTLFPIYGLDGPPIWCIVAKYKCPCCKRSFTGNEGDVLVNIPAYASSCYPVDTTYAQRDAKSHLNRTATEAFSSIMVTYGNGELCSKLLYNSINRDYIRRIKTYFSMASEKERSSTSTVPYIAKDGEFIKQYPPLGETIREMYDASCSSQKNPWCISDHDRHIREIQSVKCTGGIFAQDHTFQVTKNYQNKLGAVAAWDVATDTGEIACVVLVRSTKTEAFAHAAQQLLKRPAFSPQVKYSDTWPHKKEYWQFVIPNVKGRLGLFHFDQRIIATMRKTHIDYFDAVTDLLASLYVYCTDDYDRLLRALKNGTLSREGRKYSSEEITNMKRTRVFRDRYAKYLRKKLHGEATMIQMLDDWFCRYKVTLSGLRPAKGRLDPTRLETLFTPDTKNAIENCKEKAKYIADPLPLEDMYHAVLPNANSAHQLTEYLSKRGESKLEAFHDRFAHFANCGMRNTLADNLNLAGTARYNLSIRHKRSLSARLSGQKKRENPLNENPMSALSDPEVRKKIPVGWDVVTPCFNHSELWYVNNMAAAAGCIIPFPHAEVLPLDNGERFFSEYLTVTIPSLKGDCGPGELGECLCKLCSAPTPLSPEKPVRIVEDVAPTTTTTTTPVMATAIITNTTNNVNASINRQQASRPARSTARSVITGLNHGAAGAFTPIAPAALIPMQWQLPFYYNNNIISPTLLSPCCDKYAAWLNIRRGRPPHHPLCSQRYS